MLLLLAAWDEGAVDFGGDGVFFETHLNDEGAQRHVGLERLGLGVDDDGGGVGHLCENLRSHSGVCVAMRRMRKVRNSHSSACERGDCDGEIE